MITPSEINLDIQTPMAQQDKDAVKSYTFDLSRVLAPGDAIAACAWTVSDPALVIDASSFTPAGVSVRLKGGVVSTWYAVTGHWISVAGAQDDIVLRVYIEPEQEAVSQLGTALFPNRLTAVASLRRDRIMLLAKSVLSNVGDVSDDYLWDKLRAAEADIGRRLRVPLQLTQFFATTPTSDQIAALPVGMPWAIDPGYDYDPGFFRSERWGFIALRNRPVDSVQDVKVVFPIAGSPTSFYQIPPDWPVLDAKYGELQFVPISGTGGIALNAFMLQNMAFGRDIPFSIRVTYRAGLADTANQWPDLIDLVRKKAVLKVIEDAWLPQSGSISGDGLSQSLSFDMEKYRDTIDAAINGPKGSNGGLMAAIHGVRGLVM